MTKLTRRQFLQYASLTAAGGAFAYFWPDEGISNPCYKTRLHTSFADHDLVKAAWEGIEANQFWDIHTHLIGSGDSDSGIILHDSMQDIFSPAQYIRYKFYINASCSENEDGIDKGFVYHLRQLVDDFPSGAKCMLLAFDYNHDEVGKQNLESSPFHTPNAYAQRIAAENPERFEWTASIHPYREDCVEALHDAVSKGARAIKWLPPVMGINPDSPRCDRMYDAMSKLGISLLTHAGDEHAVDGVKSQTPGNPLLLRRPLEHGVKVIVAHCASQGVGIDLDTHSESREVDNFRLFERLMDEKKYEGRLFGDISAMTQLNRVGDALQTVLTRDDWQHRLINGSDYPLPGVMPLYSTEKLYRLGYIDRHKVPFLRNLRRYNPLLFDFVLKRHLRWQGKGFAATVFETRQHFIKPTVS